MPQDDTLKGLVDGLVSYRKNVVDTLFDPMEKHAPAVDPQPLLDTLKDETSDARRGATQNAIDFVMAHTRAMDMRKMTHKDLVDAYRTSAAFTDNYERSRVDRFNQGQV